MQAFDMDSRILATPNATPDVDFTAHNAESGDEGRRTTGLEAHASLFHKGSGCFAGQTITQASFTEDPLLVLVLNITRYKPHAPASHP